MNLWARLRARGRWIPLTFVAFFAVVLIANGALVFFAYRSWTGVETKNAYESGRLYNQTLAEEAAQRELGWQVFATFTSTGPRAGNLDLWASDADGAWLAGAVARAAFIRPTHAGNDLELALPQRRPGHYGAKVELPLSGQWDLRISISHRGQIYRTVRRIQAP